jgi:predicted alpha/beta hydrolase
MKSSASDIDIVASDGRKLAGRLFEPDGPARGAVLLLSAMGVRQDFYAPLAGWLAREGFLTQTFDYRGAGRSLVGRLRDEPADVLTWAERDCAGALGGLADRAGALPVTWVGHSLGGQVVPFVPNRERITKVVTVATGSGYWRENTPELRRRVWWLWFGVVPVAMAVCGYFPGRRLGMVGDLPKGVMAQWRRWCLNRDYAVGVEPSARAAFAAVTTPITSISFTDDELMSGRNIASIHGFYTNAPQTTKRLAPADVGVGRVGHFGFFRPEQAEPLWRPHLLPELALRQP